MEKRGLQPFKIEEVFNSDGLIHVSSIESSPSGYSIPDHIELICKCENTKLLSPDLAKYFIDQEARLFLPVKAN